MSFTLRQTKKVPRELRRLARKELRNARGELERADPPAPEAIHEARKSLKKARAIAQIVDDDHGRGLDGCEKRLRKTGRRLSRVRDADAMLEITTKFRRREPRLFDVRTSARLRAWLTKRRDAVLAEATHADTWTDVEDGLRKLRRKARRWRPSHRAFGSLARGIAASHRRGRKALARAMKKGRADDFHAWRKEVKRLWYDLRLLAPAGATVRRDVAALHHAEECLGDDHNVVVLCAALSKDGALHGTPLTVAALQHAADRYHADARKKALAAVRHIYSVKPKQYVRSLTRAWRDWQRRATRR